MSRVTHDTGDKQGYRHCIWSYELCKIHMRGAPDDYNAERFQRVDEESPPWFEQQGWRLTRLFSCRV